MVTLMSETGLRVSEAFGLEWRDLDLGQRRLSIQRRVYRGDVGPVEDESFPPARTADRVDRPSIVVEARRGISDSADVHDADWRAPRPKQRGTRRS